MNLTKHWTGLILIFLSFLLVPQAIAHGAAPISQGPFAEPKPLPVPSPAPSPIQVPLIVGPERVEAGQPAVFTISGCPPEHLRLLNWRVVPRPKDALILDLTDRTGNPVMMFWTRMEGGYAIIGDVNCPPDDFHLLIFEFGVGPPEPEPEPDPGPEPEPEPEPTPTPAVFCVIIEERDDRDDLGIQRAMIFESKKVRDLFEDGAFQVRDDDVKDEDGNTPPDIKPYIDRARKLGLPALFLVDKNGTVIFEGSLPEDVPATVELIEEYLED